MKKKDTFLKLKEEEKDIRKNIIIDAAENEFTTKPFDKVNIRDIAKEAGISPASIYRHFPDKQALFFETFLRGATDVIGIIADLNSSGEASIERLTDDFIDYFEKNDQYFRMMVKFMLDSPDDIALFEKLNATERALLEQFDQAFIEAGFKEDIRYFSHALFAALIGILIIFRNYPDDTGDKTSKHRKHIAQIIANLFQGGLT